MKDKPIVDIEKALSEKKAMQKIFICENGYPSSVLALLITYFKKQKEVRCKK